MRTWQLVPLLLLVLAACRQPAAKPAGNTLPAKGEFAFLLNYNGQMPSDVGFLTNHIVERRLANILKNDLSTFLSYTRYDRPVIVDTTGKVVAAMFYSDSDRTELSATVVIDVLNDAMWIEYITDSADIRLSDHPSLPSPMQELE